MEEDVVDDRELIESMASDPETAALGKEFIRKVSPYKYSYNFTWLGRPIIQFPQDIVAFQEIVWSTKPDLIIETGIAHGGSLILSASLLELIGGDGKVVGVDIDIRQHNRVEIECHKLFHRIEMHEGSSVDDAALDFIRGYAERADRVMVVLDSNHTHDHALKELELYAGFVTKGCYLLAFDTIIEYMPDDFCRDRPWGKGNNVATAVAEFLKRDDRFVLDDYFEKKLLVTVAPGGYLKRVKD